MTTRRLSVFCAALVLGASATAFSATSFAATPQPNPGPWREGVLMLGPSSFQVRDCMWSQAYLEYEMAETLHASFRVSQGFPYVSIAAPLHLPDGAQITRVKIDYFDSDPFSDPSMGIWGLGPTGEATLVADTSGAKDFSQGPNTVIYKVFTPTQDKTPMAYEFLVTLNRSVKDVSIEHGLYRVEVRYRYAIR